MRIDQLFEAISLSDYKPYHGLFDRSSYDEVFNKFSKYMRNGKKDRLYFPLKRRTTHSEVAVNYAKDIIRELTEFSDDNSGEMMPRFPHQYFPHLFTNTDTFYEDYLKGIARDRKGKEYRIGKYARKLIQELSKPENYSGVKYIENLEQLRIDMSEKYKKLLLKFENDPNRAAASKGIQYYVTISRHAYDVVGASTGRGWTSCINIHDGEERHYVKGYVEGGSLVAYLIQDGDWNIENPVSRIMINSVHRLVDETPDPSQGTIFLPGSVYGTATEEFKKFVRKFCLMANKSQKDGWFLNKVKQQYHFSYEKEGNKYHRGDGSPQRADRSGRFIDMQPGKQSWE